MNPGLRSRRRTKCLRLAPETIEWLNRNILPRQQGRFFDKIIEAWRFENTGYREKLP